jgi:hypothetical protein
MVTVLMNGSYDSPLSVAIYFANRQSNPPLPSLEYKNQILNGARFWKLPEKYIETVLEPIRTL